MLAEKIAQIIYGKDYVEENDRLKIALQATQVFMVPMFIAIIFLGFGYFSLSNALVFKMRFPGIEWAKGKEASYGYSETNEFGYELYGRFLSQNMGDFRYSEIEWKMQEIIQIMWPHDYSKYKKDIAGFEKTILENMVNLDFRPSVHKVVLFNGGKEATYTAEGIGIKTVSGVKEEPINCKITGKFMTSGGDVYVRSFTNDCI
ncbi:MAG: hypothetical protein COB67_00225 [SAR324 cluster bacterium]|uniref:Uncharacterized protein n=1 Tax=SAR324 cluster bacterium TaxID=2024889 RepID=A0A2A4TCR4_9DELT|nr:MAG: hypothetical protein COB67_00225 [SAR324 cluster bacterium]